MKYFKLLLSSVLLLVVSCTTIQPTFILPTGQPVTDPTYILTDTGNSNLQLTFNATVYTTVIDKDDSTVYLPQTVNMEEVYTLNNNIQRMTITAEVFNPNNIEYKFDCNITTKAYIHGISTTIYTPIKTAKSDLQYRRYTINIPFDKSLIAGEFKGELKINELTVFMVGPFNYKKDKYEEFE